VNNFVGLVIFVGIFVVVFGGRWLVAKVADRAGAKLHQTLNRSDHSDGNALYEGSWEWATTSPWDGMRQAVLAELAAQQALTPGLRLTKDTPGDGTLEFGYSTNEASFGDRFARFGFDNAEWEFTARLHAVRGVADGSGDGEGTVHFEFLSMRTFEEVGRAVPEMKTLLALVERAVKSADPQASEAGNQHLQGLDPQ
jgi:hypothetical protein